MTPITRRQFGGRMWRGAAAGAGGWALWASWASWASWTLAGCRPRGNGAPAATRGPDANAPAADPAPALRTFSAAALLTVTAVCDRLLPRDAPPTGPATPGAGDLGVPAYIDGMLATPALAGQRDLILQILPILDRQSRVRHQDRAFHEASGAEQDSLLAAWQRGRGGDARFFSAMLTLTLEGAFGDPRHGGNRGGAGFAMIGLVPGASVSAPGAAGPMRHGQPHR